MGANVFDDLKERIGDLTKSQQRAAEYILSNPLQAVFLTIDQMARKVDTSTTTIVRLTVALGYSGYAEFQRALQESTKTIFAPANRLEMHPDASNRNDLIWAIAQKQFKNLDEQVQAISEKQIMEAVLMLETAIRQGKRIYVGGSRSCYGAACYIHYNLDRMFLNCELAAPETENFSTKLNRIEKNDVVIAISLMRYTKAMVCLEEIARERGAKVIAITDSLVSPMAKNATLLFKVACETMHFHNSIIGIMMLAEQLIGAITNRNREVIRHNLLQAEDILVKTDVHVLNDKKL